jgi:hypothetical protein
MDPDVMLRARLVGLLSRCWELRQNLTFYDAAYVALAEALHSTLLTGDRRLARSSGPSCPIETIKSSSARRRSRCIERLTLPEPMTRDRARNRKPPLRKGIRETSGRACITAARP